MLTEGYFDSCGEGKIHYCRWAPEGEVRAVVQIVHGIAEHVLRYEDFAEFLNSRGILVTAEDHMGHGKSMDSGTQGYFAGGWFTALEDVRKLTELTAAEYPGVPYFMLGHSMGSFLLRSYLIRYPEAELAGAIICGTGWMPEAVLNVGITTAKAVCARYGERKPSELLNDIAFGSYNKRVEHKRTKFDWLNRDDRSVDMYIADPLCGFLASGGLIRDMLYGMRFNQQKKHLQKMNRELSVFFIAGGDDPVGNYGKGVRQTAKKFREIGMADVSEKIYPLMRHEILNEINHQSVYDDVLRWLEPKIG